MQKNFTHDRGFTLLATTAFIGFILTLSLVAVNYTITAQKTATFIARQDNALQLAQAGIDKAVRCLNATTEESCGANNYGVNYLGETNTAVGNGTFTVTISGSGNNRTLTSVGTTSEGVTARVKIDSTTIPDGDDGLVFTYALQVGQDGAYVANNATVNGTVYSNGNITCGTNGRINGDAYSALTDGSISGCRVDYDAHADRILNSDIYRNAYFRTDPSDITGTTVSGTRFPNQTTPVQSSIPELDIDFWHTSAEAGGTTNGNLSPETGTTIGPLKIVGDLTIGGDNVITLAGPIWVTGNVTIENGATIQLASSFGANGTVILADHPTDKATYGRITVSNNAIINGSGNALSHILIVSTNTSTSDSEPAIELGNNAEGAIFYATDGSIRIQNNAIVKSVVGQRLYLNNNAAVTYVQSEMIGTNFSNSPGGSWRLIGDTWRQVP